jgi:hypothetical protein
MIWSHNIENTPCFAIAIFGNRGRGEGVVRKVTVTSQIVPE